MSSCKVMYLSITLQLSGGPPGLVECVEISCLLVYLQITNRNKSKNILALCPNLLLDCFNSSDCYSTVSVANWLASGNSVGDPLYLVGFHGQSHQVMTFCFITQQGNKTRKPP